MIYKLSDGTRVRTTRDGEVVEFEYFRYNPRKEVFSMERLSGEAAENRLAEIIVGDAIRFGEVYGAGPLAFTGRPLSAAIVGAALATVAGIGFILAPDAQAPAYPLLKDVVTAPVLTPTPASPKPYKPEPRKTTLTSREGVREALTPTPSAGLAKPSKKPATKHAIPTPPADVRISFYRQCSAAPQPCIDDGALTMYAGNILAGHNYMGYQWLSRVPVGRTVRVISGPLAGTFEVYGHLRIDRQGGTIPAFAGSPDLVLQSCEGSGTGFSLLHRI